MLTSQLFTKTFNEAVDEEVFFTINDPEIYDTVFDQFSGDINWHGDVLAVNKGTWSRINQMVAKMGFDPSIVLNQMVDEVTVIHDNPSEPKNPSVRPDGGLGTWDVSTLRSSLTRQLAELSKMINHNARGVEYLLYKAGAIQAKIDALAKTEAYLEKVGRRRVAKDREVDLG